MLSVLEVRTVPPLLAGPVPLAEPALLSVLVRRGVWAAARPVLPEVDRPPVGLGRPVPVGRQPEEECAAGRQPLERWLAAPRRR